MKKTCMLLAVFATICTTGCEKNDVPDVQDVHNIQVDGQAMTQQAFLETFCTTKKDHPTCMKVAHAMRQDSAKRDKPIPRF